MRKLLISYFIFLVSIISISCESLFPEGPSQDQILDGPIEGLSPDQQSLFLKGDIAFNDEVFTPLSGLGPIFVATSCGTCHPGDGKGHPFTTLTRFGQIDESGNQYLNQGGPQLQNRAIPGFDIEEIPPGSTFTKFTPPANTGLGYLEAVSDADLLAMADPTDANGDGISGEVNWITLPDFLTPSENHINNNGKFIGRFGKKAGAFNLTHQTVNAYIQDMGITTDYHPQELLHGSTGNILNDNVPDPELTQSTVDQVVFYLQTLKAPIQRQQGDQGIVSGKNLFLQLGCESCHKQTLKTGISTIASLSTKEFHPYTDLLLHDMGSALDDGYTEGNAKTNEWRTPPLWGLGLSKNSQGGEYFLLHDGRARSIEQAILLHGGEGKKSHDAFEALTHAEKQNLIQFLETL
jgi:CxxC motif-containing protein (DUF1111 family)